MHMYDIKEFAKMKKRSRDPDTNNKNMQPWYKNGIWYWKVFNERKVGKTVEGMELPN